MAFHVNPNGHAPGGGANLDSLSMLYIALTVIWTAFLAVGIAILIANKNLPFLRIRNLSLGIAAVCLLHVYWVLAMLVYTMDGAWPCGVEFWVMSIYLPFGIALYQANSTVLRQIAGLQRIFASSQNLHLSIKSNAHVRGWRGWVMKWQRMNLTERAMYGIGLGMLAQVRHSDRDEFP